MFLGRSVCCLCVRIVICSPIIRSFNTLCILYFEQGVFRVYWPVDAWRGMEDCVYPKETKSLAPRSPDGQTPCCFVLLMSGLIKWWQKRTMAIISQLQTIQHCTLHSPRLNRPWRGTGAEEEGSGHHEQDVPCCSVIIEDELMLCDEWWIKIFGVCCVDNDWWEYQQVISPPNLQIIRHSWGCPNTWINVPVSDAWY